MDGRPATWEPNAHPIVPDQRGRVLNTRFFRNYALGEYTVCIVPPMATSEVVLALLRLGPAHGYDVKQDHDAWFPDSRPLAFGQVYATLSRLERDGLVEVVETRTDGGPEKIVYALTASGEQHLAGWLAQPSELAATGADEIVRKAVAALRTGGDPARFLAAQRTAHLRRMHELSEDAAGDEAARLARDHLIAHLDADLRWLDLAAARVAANPPAPTRSQRTSVPTVEAHR
jgi:DNA-binding PadR family transcriptional regulator